ERRRKAFTKPDLLSSPSKLFLRRLEHPCFAIDADKRTLRELPSHIQEEPTAAAAVEHPILIPQIEVLVEHQRPAAKTHIELIAEQVEQACALRVGKRHDTIRGG